MASPLMVRSDNRLADPVSNRVSQCLLAASKSAAVNWRDYGTSRSQLFAKLRRLPACAKEVFHNCAVRCCCWPITSTAQVRTSASYTFTMPSANVTLTARFK